MLQSQSETGRAGGGFPSETHQRIAGAPAQAEVGEDLWVPSPGQDRLACDPNMQVKRLALSNMLVPYGFMFLMEWRL